MRGRGRVVLLYHLKAWDGTDCCMAHMANFPICSRRVQGIFTNLQISYCSVHHLTLIVDVDFDLEHFLCRTPTATQNTIQQHKVSDHFKAPGSYGIRQHCHNLVNTHDLEMKSIKSLVLAFWVQWTACQGCLVVWCLVTLWPQHWLSSPWLNLSIDCFHKHCSI